MPQLDDQDTHLYSEFSSIEIHAGKLASEFAIIYRDSEDLMIYQSLIRLGEGSQPIEFEIQMNEIPLINDKGLEIVAKWKFDGIENENVFYTDSNGLEM